MSRPKISAEVSAEEMAAYRNEAKRMGFTLSEWMRRALNSSLAKTTAPPQVMDEAYAKLDAPEGQTALQTLLAGPEAKPKPPPPPPAPAAAPPPTFDKLPTNLRPQSTHPCMYLNPAMPGVLREGEAQGTCDQNTQRGKPCYWNAQNAAKNCGVFALRLDLRAAKAAQPQPRRLTR